MIWHIITCFSKGDNFIFSEKHLILLRKNFLLFGDNLFCLIGEKLSCSLKRQFISFLLGKNFILQGEKLIIFWENFTLVKEIFSHRKAFCFLRREFLSDFINFFSLRWNRLWNKWAQKAAAKFSIGWAWPSSAQLVLETFLGKSSSQLSSQYCD